MIKLQSSESALSSPLANSKLPLSSNQDEMDITNAVRSILEESQQIAELTEMEKVYSVHVVRRFSEIALALKGSYHIKPESVAKSDSSVTDVVLTAKGEILIFHANKLVTSTPLESFRSDNLIKILEETIPKADLLLKERRQKIGQRVATLENVVSEIKKVTAAGSRQEPRESSRNLERHPR